MSVPASAVMLQVSPVSSTRLLRIAWRSLLAGPFISEAVANTMEPGEAVLYFQKPPKPHRPHTYWLSATGNQVAAARSLFAKLRQIDQRGCRLIHVELAPPGSMAEAINDRLRRAAAKG